MTTEILNPTSPGQRGTVRLSTELLYKGRPHSALTVSKKRISGRNNLGRITVRHRGGGHKRLYRLIDFKRDKLDIIGKVETIEYDPNRSANIALICYSDGERRYVLAPAGLEIGQSISSGTDVPIKLGNSLLLRDIPVGTTIHCVEMRPGKGAQLARAAGTSAQLLGRDNSYAQLRLKSGEIRKIHVECRATIGHVSNNEHNLIKLGKAGAKRWRGIRPTVRGVAMNPIDHPHGGGEGKTAAGRHPVSPWGTKTKGFRTRRNKRTDKMIIRRRSK